MYSSIIDNNLTPVIAVDFDGTICRSNYPECGEPEAGVKESLQRLRDLGFLILVYSCRTCSWHFDRFGVKRETPIHEREAVINMENWLKEHDIPFDEIDYGTRGKPLADYYIDDRGLRYECNWDEITNFIESRMSTC